MMLDLLLVNPKRCKKKYNLKKIVSSAFSAWLTPWLSYLTQIKHCNSVTLGELLPRSAKASTGSDQCLDVHSLDRICSKRNLHHRVLWISKY